MQFLHERSSLLLTSRSARARIFLHFAELHLTISIWDNNGYGTVIILLVQKRAICKHAGDITAADISVRDSRRASCWFLQKLDYDARKKKSDDCDRTMLYLTGNVELQINLLTQEEASMEPVGKKRRKPNHVCLHILWKSQFPACHTICMKRGEFHVIAGSLYNRGNSLGDI